MSAHDEFFKRLLALDLRSRAALRDAALRNGTKDPIAFVAFTSAHRRARVGASRWACYLAALLFFWYPRVGPGASLDQALRRLPRKEGEGLLRALLSSSEVSLQTSLLAVVQSTARAKVPLNWSRVLDDLNDWKRAPGTVCARWAKPWV